MVQISVLVVQTNASGLMREIMIERCCKLHLEIGLLGTRLYISSRKMHSAISRLTWSLIPRRPWQKGHTLTRRRSARMPRQQSLWRYVNHFEPERVLGFEVSCLFHRDKERESIGRTSIAMFLTQGIEFKERMNPQTNEPHLYLSLDTAQQCVSSS